VADQNAAAAQTAADAAAAVKVTTDKALADANKAAGDAAAAKTVADQNAAAAQTAADAAAAVKVTTDKALADANKA
ncbi:hypothetical protein, partial [Mycobacteroides sp. H063]